VRMCVIWILRLPSARAPVERRSPTHNARFDTFQRRAVRAPCARWVPVRERSRSLALVYSGMYTGSILGLALSPHMIELLHWPSVFYVFGSLGVVWFLLWGAQARPPGAPGAVAAHGRAAALAQHVLRLWLAGRRLVRAVERPGAAPPLRVHRRVSPVAACMLRCPPRPRGGAPVADLPARRGPATRWQRRQACQKRAAVGGAPGAERGSCARRRRARRRRIRGAPRQSAPTLRLPQ
jgi:hypothetical protein